MADPEGREGFDRVREAMERVRSGESDREEIRLPSGDKVRIHRDARFVSGIRIETPEKHQLPSFDGPPRGAISGEISPATDQTGSGEAGELGKGFRAQAFGPAEERPPTYPADLPFVPHCAVTISAFGSRDGSEEARNVAWMRLSDPGGTLQEIKAQLRETGWTEGNNYQASAYTGHTRTFLFTRGRVDRAVALIAFGEFSQIMLFERAGP